MIPKNRQKNIPNETYQPKSVLSRRLNQQSSSLCCRLNLQNSSRQNLHSKSVKKERSIKYLKQISPKQQLNSTNSFGNNILRFLESYDQKQDHFKTKKKDFLNSRQDLNMLKNIQNENNRNCQTSRQIYECKSKPKQKCRKKEIFLQKYQSNEQKVTKMRFQLQKVFQNFKQREKSLAQMKTALKGKESIKRQNSHLRNQIDRIQQMIKQALLERQKLKHGPFNQLNKRKHR